MIKAIYDVNIRFTGKGEIRMKKKKNLLCFVLLISLIFTMAFGSVTVSAAPKLNRTKVTLLKGEKTTLKVTGTKQKVAWRSSKKSVATVNSKGQVVAQNKGSATIYAKVSKKTYKCVVKVETPKLSRTSLTLTEKKSSAIKLTGTTVCEGEIFFFQSEDRTCGFQRKDHRSEKRNSSDHSEGKYKEIQL